MFDEINYSYLWNGAGYDVTPKFKSSQPKAFNELEQYDITGLFCMRVHYVLVEAATKLRDYIKYRTHTEKEF